jgi:hypothetical protein
VAIVPISQSDIESLARKVGALESDLTPNERALLVGILQEVSAAITRSGVQEPAGDEDPGERTTVVVASVDDDAPSLHVQFLNAFTQDPQQSAAPATPSGVGLAHVGSAGSIGRSATSIGRSATSIGRSATSIGRDADGTDDDDGEPDTPPPAQQ